MPLADAGIVVNQVDESTAIHIVHNNPKYSAVIDKECIQKVDDIFMLPFLHDGDFVKQRLLAILTRQIHFFDSNACLGTFLLHQLLRNTDRGASNRGHVDGSRRSLTDLFVLLIRQVRITLRYQLLQSRNELCLGSGDMPQRLPPTRGDVERRDGSWQRRHILVWLLNLLSLFLQGQRFVLGRDTGSLRRLVIIISPHWNDGQLWTQFRRLWRRT